METWNVEEKDNREAELEKGRETGKTVNSNNDKKEEQCMFNVVKYLEFCN